MKKAFQKIKLRKLKTEINKKSFETIEGTNFLIWYKNNTCKEIYSKDDLMWELRHDLEKPIQYIFDMTDRIIVERNIIIEEE